MTLTLSAVIAVSLVKRSEADDASKWMTTLIVGLALGALIANLTPIGRYFRRWSAIVVALVIWVVGMIALGLTGGAGLNEDSGLFLFGLWCVIAALDLCFVSRLRTMVILSGLVMVPLVAALDSSALFSAFAWFSSAIFAMWLLSTDEQRALRRPEPVDGVVGKPRARGSDLAVTIAMALLVGFTLAFLMSTPSCSLSPLGKALEWMPWHPQIKPNWEPGDGRPLRLLELDRNGHETRTYLNKKGRRFMVDPATGEPFGVVDRDGSTSVVDLDGREVGRFEDGDFVAVGPDGEEVRYHRDDDGWYVETKDGTRFRIEPGAATTMRDESGRTVGIVPTNRPGQLRIDANDQRLSELDRDGDGMIPAPNDAVLDATTGYGDSIRSQRVDGETSVEDPEHGEHRVYRHEGDGYDVSVDSDYGSDDAHSYHVDRKDDTVTAYDSDGNEVLSIDVDRKGNALDDIDGRDFDMDDQQPKPDRDRPSPPWKAIAIVVTTLAALGAAFAFWVWWKRRRTEAEAADRDWAEEQVRRLEAWGRDHTFPRERAESVVRYLTRLDFEIAQDGTLAPLGDVLDDALFGRRPLPVDTRLRTEATIDRLIEEHPKPGRAERLRGGPDHGGSKGIRDTDDRVGSPPQPV
ncbi:MAG: hypothetical protein KDB02_12355 [Acidimicrobiales bacterium]|nr:hypothetical protein [Acidimicrobiales bacterium]